MAAEVLCYSLAKIVAEDACPAPDTTKIGDTRMESAAARDYYILSDFSSLLKGIDLDELLRRKSAHRGETYASLADFFTTEFEEEAHRHVRPGAWSPGVSPNSTPVTIMQEVDTHFI